MICTELLKPSSSDGRSKTSRSILPYLVIGLVMALLLAWRLTARPDPGWTSSPSSLAAVAPTATNPRVATPSVPAGAPLTRAPAASVATPIASAASHPQRAPASGATPVGRPLRLIVDDFEPRPIQGQQMFFYNRLEGDRGAINSAQLTFGTGQVTTTISAGNSWAGAWMSLNHPIREGLGIDLDAILPPQILSPYQSSVVGIEAQVAGGTPGGVFRLELKDHGAFRWTREAVLSGGRQAVSFDLEDLGSANELVWILDRAQPTDFVVLDSIAFTVTSPITDPATAGFVWSYGQLLNNWNSETGLVRDKARDASGEFDAVQATGSLAAATALAAQLGIVSHDSAVQVVDRIGHTLVNDLPRLHGLWPHWVKIGASGKPVIVSGTEWSSMDTVIAAIGLLTAQSGLGLDTSQTEEMLRKIDWSDLLKPNGIRHGYTEAGDLLPYAWDTFGGESWLVALAHAAATGQVAPLTYPNPPTANGSGFIGELAWLWAPPPYGLDAWGNDWKAYRQAAADTQLSYFPTHYPASCLTTAGLFGLSAAEGPEPGRIAPSDIYQAFGVGGRFAGPNDGSVLWGAPVVIPHYAGMIASLRPEEATDMWNWLMGGGYFTPLTNVESSFFDAKASCKRGAMIWNALKGSWNLALQVLGWGRYLAQRRGETPVIWRAVTLNAFLRKGYIVLAPNGPDSGPARKRTFLPVVSLGTR